MPAGIRLGNRLPVTNGVTGLRTTMIYCRPAIRHLHSTTRQLFIAADYPAQTIRAVTHNNEFLDGDIAKLRITTH
jgi:hypothetical protein